MPDRYFISIDGLDGCGKSTQTRHLADWLRNAGFAVTECADPGGTPMGQVIRDALLSHRLTMSVTCEMFLFMASRAQLVAEVIRPALEVGRVVVSDRFLLANVVYQGHAGGLDPEAIWNVGRFATGGVEPDLTIVLDLPVDVAQSRRVGVADRFESRDRAFHEAVRAGFLAEARRQPERIRVIDANLPTEAIHQLIREEVSRVLGPNPRT